MIGVVGVVGDELGGDRLICLAADEDVGVPAAVDPAVVEDDVALEVEAVEVAALGVGVDAPAELLKDDVVVHLLVRGAEVLRVDAVAVAAVRSRVAVVVEEAPVDTGAGGDLAGDDALGRVVDDHVDHAGAVAHLQDARAAAGRRARVEVTRVGSELKISKPQYQV